MTDFLLLAFEDEAAHASQTPRAMAELIAERARFAEGLRRRGRLRDHGRFRPSREGKRVGRDGVQDGPFAEEGRSLAAYYWIDAAGVEEAARLAGEVPVLDADAVDVRPLRKGVVVPDGDAKPGKIFAFAVLGRATSEEAWSAVMDRIDAETHDGFPDDAFAGGNRLEAPRAGRRVTRRATFDGPFLESKEVIGGVFFLRMMSTEEAVAWALTSRFVVHGALEIREVWRS